MIPLGERWHVVCRSCDDLEELAPTESDASDLAGEHTAEQPDHVVATAPVTPRGYRVATDGGVDVDALATAHARIVDARVARNDQTSAWTRACEEAVFVERVGPSDSRTHVVAFETGGRVHDVTVVDVEPRADSRRYMAACDCLGFRTGEGACSHVLAVVREHTLRDSFVPDVFVDVDGADGVDGTDDRLQADGGDRHGQ